MQSGLDRCLAFINCGMKSAGAPGFGERNGVPWKAVTISRQAGAGAHRVAELLAQELQARSPHGARPWTVFDRNLVETVLEDHHLPGRLSKFMPEDRVPQIEDTLDDLFGVHPPTETLVRQTAETILRLAEVGNAILIGRGANVVTSKLESVFHVRLVGALEKRIEYVRKVKELAEDAATTYVRKEDCGRRRYLRKYYGKDVDDPLLYHLVINTSLLSYEATARIVADAVLSVQGEQSDRAA